MNEKRWEIWKAGDVRWLEKASGRQEIRGMQTCIASFTATAEKAHRVMEALR